MLEHPAGGLIVYEGGVLSLGLDVKVIWHQQKLYNDFFVKIEDDKAWFERDHEQRWSLSLKDGTRTGIQ